MSKCSMLLGAILVAISASLAGAQAFRTLPDDEWCDKRDFRRTTHCEVREATLPAGRDVIAVDGGGNGGISVQGWDRDEILVRAKVSVHGLGRDEAAELASQIEIETDGEIQADGPRARGGNTSWVVSYEIKVPHRSALSLRATNGGIAIADVQGDIEFASTNGGVRLSRLAGDVAGETTNGGVSIELAGSTWNGEGLDVETTNGGVDLAIPEDYSARLVVGTVNGGVRSDFGATKAQRRARSITTKLGDGGPLLRVRTTNGGVSVQAT